jgi:hypothetical protein
MRLKFAIADRKNAKAEKGWFGGLFGGPLTLELMIAKFFEPRTAEFIEPLHGN